jgi:major membrane immunogen (membrane-anchored lipoprotein)
MKLRRFVLLVIVLLLLLTACARKSRLTFTNKTECGTATIRITNTDTGTLKEYTLQEGDKLEIEVDPSVTYNYEVEYAGHLDSDITCETKRASVSIPKGQNANVKLASVTPTPQSE